MTNRPDYGDHGFDDPVLDGPAIRATISVDAYKVISRAVEEGVAYGWRRAHKHTDAPDDATAIDTISTAVMNELCEWLMFGDGERP